YVGVEGIEAGNEVRSRFVAGPAPRGVAWKHANTSKEDGHDDRTRTDPAECVTVGITTGRANADERSGGCPSLPNWKDLRQSLSAANAHVNLILNNNMWATIVAADGTVCAVAYTGDDALEAQWLLSRVISAQKANTANGLSLQAGEGPNSTFKGLALSTANLWKAVQPGGSLYGLQHSNPVNTDVAYRGSSQAFGTAGDPMIGGRIGGVNVFGGGLALYDDHG